MENLAPTLDACAVTQSYLLISANANTGHLKMSEHITLHSVLHITEEEPPVCTTGLAATIVTTPQIPVMESHGKVEATISTVPLVAKAPVVDK